MNQKMEPVTGSASQKKKSSFGKIIAVAAVVIVILVVLIAIGVMSLFREVAGPQNAARDFVETAAAGDVAGAYASTSVAFQSVTTEEDLALFLEAFPVLAEAEDVSFHQFSIENDTAVVTGTISGAGETSPITFTLAHEEGEWRIVNFSLNPEDVPDFNEGETQE